jgi:4-amino-4-deoxy-L-arabinose transferase-like glycosyltransferase
MDGFQDNKSLVAETVRKHLTIRFVTVLESFYPRSEELRVFWIVVALFFSITRILPTPEYFSIDNVNLALALERFDPRVHQPQPPGYPLFVAFSTLVNSLVADARTTFAIVSFVVCGLCVPLIFALARRMFSLWVAKAATLLFVVNPVFWYGGLNGPLRPNLALFSLVAAYCAWRAWQGERRFVAWGALGIGVGSGFRPEILVNTFPLWVASAWLGTRSVRTLLTGLLVMAAGVLTWFSMLVVAVGGPGPLWTLMSAYAVEQSRNESVLFGAAIAAWLNQVNRLFIWNGIALLGAAWAIPWFFKAKDRVGFRSHQSSFLAVWVLPGLTIQALTHVAAPGHTLFSTPALCIVSAYILWVAIPRLVRHNSLVPQARETALCGAAFLNLLMFLNVFPVPTTPSTGVFTQVRNAVAFGIFETSLGQLRWYDSVTRDSLRDIRTYTPKNPSEPAILVSSDVHSKVWFMNWRIARYYLPNREMWVIADRMDPPMAQLVQRDKVIETRTGQTVQLPIPCKGRILWLIENGGPVYTDLSRTWELDGSPLVVVTATQVGSKCPTFRVKNFEFVPQ